MVTYTADSPLRRTMSHDEVDLDALEGWFASQNAGRMEDVSLYLDVLLTGCLYLKLDYWLALGQFDLETDTGRSEPWRTGCNPGGLGMTRPGGYPANPNAQRWTNGSEAAFAHLAHLTAYVYGNDWADVWHERWPDPFEIDKRFGIAVYTYGAMAQTPFALNMTWAIDPENNYHGKLAARANRLVMVAGKDTEPMALNIRQSIIPAGRGNRPGTTLNAGPLWLTTHDTGNPGRGANAEMHRAFVHNPNTSVSFHFTVDDKEAIQLLPLNEVGYHAADGCNNRATDIGCFQSIATELCINSDGDWWQAYANLKDLYAAIITGDSRIAYAGRGGDFSETRLTTHQKVSDTGKYCPATILNKGLVADLTAGVVNRVKIIRDQQPTPEPEYAKTFPVGKGTQLINGHLFLAPGGKTVQRDQAPMQFADADTVPTGPVFPKGHKFSQEDITHYVQGTDGNLWVILRDGSRFPAMAFVDE